MRLYAAATIESPIRAWAARTNERSAEASVAPRFACRSSSTSTSTVAMGNRTPRPRSRYAVLRPVGAVTAATGAGSRVAVEARGLGTRTEGAAAGGDGCTLLGHSCTSSGATRTGMGAMVGLRDAFVSRVRPPKEGGVSPTDKKCLVWSTRLTVGDAYPPTVMLPPLRTGQPPPPPHPPDRGTVVIFQGARERPAQTTRGEPDEREPDEREPGAGEPDEGRPRPFPPHHPPPR